MTFETLVPDIQELFNGKDLSERIHHLTKNLGDDLVSRFIEYASERKASLRLSNVGRPLRQLWYELKGYKGEPLSPEAKFKFLYGSLIESLVLHLAREAGHSVTDEQREVSVDGVIGHIDAIIDQDYVVDVKSCSSRSFEKFQSGKLFTDDPFGYVAQLSGYALALGLPKAAFIAVDKTLGKICVLELPSEVIESYNVSKRIKEVRTAMDSDTEPARCYEPQPVSKTDKSGNLVLSIGCSYCSFKKYCWRDSNNGAGLQTRFYASGPKDFVQIVKEPKLKYEQRDEFPVKES